MRFPRTAKVAKYVAIGAIPVCWLVGAMFVTDQGDAGAGILKAILFLFGVAIAVLAGIVYVIARFGVRPPRGAVATVKRNPGRTLVTIALFGGLIGALFVIPSAAPQSYSLWVSHQYVTDITAVTVTFGDERRSFDRIPAKMASLKYDLSTRPEVAEVAWQDPAGTSHTVTTHVKGDVPDKYHNGQVRIAIVSNDDVRASFRFPR